MSVFRRAHSQGAESARRSGVASAALVLASIAMGHALATTRPRHAAPWPACPNPIELGAHEGATRMVGCASRVGEGPAIRGPARLLFGRVIDLNRADARTLTSLPGIGPGRAQAIVEARAKAPFAGLGDLERVRGIGPKTVERLRGWAGVDTPHPAEPAAAGAVEPEAGKAPTLGIEGS